MNVDLITFCCHKDIHKLHAPGALETIVMSHRHRFDNVIVVHQRCQGIEYRPFDYPARIVESENHLEILSEFGLPEVDELADHYTHGPQAAHYWKWHVINHLIGLKESRADYVVFADCDCWIIDSQPQRSWIAEGIDILERYHDILLVSPSDGGSMFEKRIPEARLTQNNSQQLFLCSRARLASIDWAVPWDWEYTAPGGPMQEYYYMAEGRIWRYMHKHDLWRAILPTTWRYWHHQW